MTDQLKITDANDLFIPYLLDRGTIYMRESLVSAYAETHELDDIYSVCEAVLNDRQLNPYGITNYKLINDVKDSMEKFYNESAFYEREILPENDDILLKMEWVESINEVTDSTVTAAKFNTFITKTMGIFRKGNYKEAPAVEMRLNKCKNALSSMEKELAAYQKLSDKEKESINFHKNVQVITNSLTGIIGAGIPIPFSMKMNKQISSGMKLGAAIKIIISSIKVGSNISTSYESMLNNYIKNLKRTAEYLEQEVASSKISDKQREEKNKEKSVKESSINESSIMDIMNEKLNEQ